MMVAADLGAQEAKLFAICDLGFAIGNWDWEFAIGSWDLAFWELGPGALLRAGNSVARNLCDQGTQADDSNQIREHL